MSLTLDAILSSQSSLLQEAAEALPHQFTQCTYAKGHIRQSVYLCLTCAVPRGICSACSIACHTDHEQLELFPKRNFRCDCPTDALAHPCALHKTHEAANDANAYGQNFRGVFCRCAREYDPRKERETMIQCLACEDWFHESCLNLRERPPSRGPTPEPAQEAAEADADDTTSDVSDNLPPPLLRASDYDSFVCGACVRSIDVVKRYAGTPGALMVIQDSPGDNWKIIGTDEPESMALGFEAKQEPNSDSAEVGAKRARSASPSSADLSQAKKPRLSSAPSICLAPPPSLVAQSILSNYKPSETAPGLEGTREEKQILGFGDVFLTEGFRGRWCLCEPCTSQLKKYRYLLDEEETYEPPQDPDSGLSLEELGLRALQRLPRDRAIDGIRAFNEMRDDLMHHLRPFAQEGKEVTEADIRAFFDARMQAAKSGQS
ncbi:hypothetical protein CERSUDRAFT_156081 [Gelatoporia subvermispora B]|uniref:UBR-type domain-containing protein n=1 Tax=Ceriporiopsis subvermispora (strain B) TaxID=914234 RepID=M2RDD1_CERS8|nr:hypothetical protein CERSUDRAFT_156081 [Gelatoporia subvermispora B]